jgi:hypothetical protein
MQEASGSWPHRMLGKLRTFLSSPSEASLPPWAQEEIRAQRAALASRRQEQQQESDLSKASTSERTTPRNHDIAA